MAQRTIQRPNVLGRAMRFFTDAVAYAREPLKAPTQGNGRINPLMSRVLTSNARVASGGDTGQVEQYVRLAFTNPYFMGAVNRISNRVVSGAKFVIEERDTRSRDYVEITDFPLLDVFESPNPLFPMSELLAELVFALSTYGNAYWFLATDAPGMGDINEIWPLMPDKVEPDPMTLRRSPMTGQPIIDFQYTVGERIRLPGENVIHFRTPNLMDFWRGMAPMSGMQRALRMDASQTDWLASFFSESNAVPTAIISVPPDLTEEEFETVKEDIIFNFGTQRGAAITRAGTLDVETIQHTIEEMQVLDGLEYNKGAVMEVLGVPQGIGNASSGESRLAAEMAMMRDAVQPMLDLIASAWTPKINMFYLAPGGGRLRCRAVDIVPQDTAVATAEYTTFGADRTLNENRAERKLPPLKFKDDALKSFQPLLDEVPQRYVELFMPVFQQGQQPQVDPMTGMPVGGAPGMPAPAPNGASPAQQAFGLPGPQLQPQNAQPQSAPGMPGMPRPMGGANTPKPQGNQPTPMGERAGGFQRRSLSLKGASIDEGSSEPLDPAELAVKALIEGKPVPTYLVEWDTQTRAVHTLYQKSLAPNGDELWSAHRGTEGWTVAHAPEPSVLETLQEVSADYAQRYVRRQSV